MRRGCAEADLWLFQPDARSLEGGRKVVEVQRLSNGVGEIGLVCEKGVC